MKQAYIPDIYGKERRKRVPGKEGKLGVEGMKPDVLLASLERAGATFLDEESAAAQKRDPITKADLFALGLTGGQDSSATRQVLLRKLGLPAHLPSNGLLEAPNLLYSRAAFLKSTETF